MSAHSCCGPLPGSRANTTGAQAAIRGPRPRTLVQRCLGVGKWIVPGGILAVLPKCPVCLAAYLALGAGLGVSISTAAYLRMILAGACVAWLLYLAARGPWSFPFNLFHVCKRFFLATSAFSAVKPPFLTAKNAKVAKDAPRRAHPIAAILNT